MQKKKTEESVWHFNIHWH